MKNLEYYFEFSFQIFLKIENNLLKNLRLSIDKSVSNNDIIPTLNHIFKIKNENFKYSYLSEGYSL